MDSKIFHLPDYCDLFKQFLVEELIFYESPLEFHFGKCSIIGKLCIRDNLHYLQNISLSSLDEEYRLKTGLVEILLLPTNYRSNPTDLSSFRHLVDGLFYEVHGETAFKPKQGTVNLKTLTINTMELIIQLRMKHLKFAGSVSSFDVKDIAIDSIDPINESEIDRDIKCFGMNYIPAIQVHTMNEIDKAEELLQTNLQFRLLRNERHQNNYL